jgi:hypothetical protein
MRGGGSLKGVVEREVIKSQGTTLQGISAFSGEWVKFPWTGLVPTSTGLLLLKFSFLFLFSFFFFFFFAVLGFELRAYTLSHSTSPFM